MFYYLLFLLILLYIGILIYHSIKIYNSNKDLKYPGNISKCPDFYIIKGDNCLPHPIIYDVENINNNCKVFNYTLYDTDTINSYCIKKKWTKNCNVLWDGISNRNDLIC